jgi:hypothetical protein
MIRNYLTPKEKTVTFTVPGSYIGKPVEILTYSRKDIRPAVDRKPFDPRRFCGTLTSEEADRYYEYLREARA